MLIVKSENPVFVHFQKGNRSDDQNVKTVVEEQVPDASGKLEREA